jgi:hypothetical protein
MADGNLPLAKKLAVDNPDVTAELAILQKEIRHPSHLSGSGREIMSGYP